MAEKPLDALRGEVLHERPAEEEARKVDRLVERLKRQREGDREGKARSFERLKAHVAGAARRARLNFGRVGGELSKRADLRNVGRFYLLFEKPVAGLASLLFSLPAAQAMHEDLESADLRFGVETYLVLVVTFSLVLGAVAGLFSLLVGTVLEDDAFFLLAPVFGVLTFVVAAVFGVVYPAMRANERALKINRELPFALRQLSTEIRAGVSFNKALQSVASARYGALSEELSKVVRDMEAGESTEDALEKLISRTRSRGFKRALVQLVRALRSGGRLSEVVNTIAADVAFETRMSVRDFTEILNLISVIYIVVAVVTPVTLTILSAIIQLPLIGGSVPKVLVFFAFLGVAAGVGAIIFITQRLEPST